MNEQHEQNIPTADEASSSGASPANPISPADAPGSEPAGPAPTRRRWGLAAAAALGVALFAVPLLRGPEAGSSGPPERAAVPGGAGTCSAPTGSAKLDFTLKDMNGATVRLADYKGKVLLINFWATWCGPCRTEIPELVTLVDEHKAKGFEVVGVSIDDSPEQLRAFAQEMKMNYPSLLMLDDLDTAFGPMWALPTTFLIDRNGSICLKHMGPVTKEMVEREIKGLL
jgi:peroxiredoxin